MSAKPLLPETEAALHAIACTTLDGEDLADHLTIIEIFVLQSIEKAFGNEFARGFIDSAKEDMDSRMNQGTDHAT